MRHQKYFQVSKRCSCCCKNLLDLRFHGSPQTDGCSTWHSTHPMGKQNSGVPRLLCALCSVQQTAFSNEQPLLTEETAINVGSWELSCSQAAEHRQVGVSGFRKAHKLPWCVLQSIEIKTANLFESSEFKLRRRYHIFNGTEGPKREEISEQKLLALKTTTLSTYILFLGFTFKTSSDLASRVSDSSK